MAEAKRRKLIFAAKREITPSAIIIAASRLSNIDRRYTPRHL